jgi:hypothetical protein
MVGYLRSATLFAWAGVLLGACGGDPEALFGDEGGGPAEPPALAALLAGGRAFEIVPTGRAPGSAIGIALEGKLVPGGGPVSTPLAIRAGSMTLASTPAGGLAVTALDLSIEDVVVGPSAAPLQGLRLADVGVSLGESAVAPASWSEQGAVASPALDLRLRWAVVLDGEHKPLADQDLAALSAEVEVTSEPGLVASLRIAEAGPVWSFGELLAITDVAAELEARAAP